jgi:carbamate kinase
MDSKGKLALIAVGGNALIIDPKHTRVEDQYLAVMETARHIAAFIKQGYRVIVTHGNGPQVGFVLRRSEIARDELHEVPLDSCGADTQGAIGYQLQMALDNEMRGWADKPTVATVITQTLVDRNDPSFQNPTKPIGSFMSEALAMEHKEKDGWNVVEDAGRGWRRVVASPVPKKMFEFDAIKLLLDAGVVVVAAGGGGIPVIEREDGSITGAAAVIDKDLGSSLLAQQLTADFLVISTAVEQVSLNFNKPDEKKLTRVTLSEAKKYMAEGHFAAGSMKPKVQAIIEFLEKNPKGEALITDPAHIVDAFAGKTGTWFVQG